MMVSMLASSSLATVSSRRCCCVLAMSDRHFGALPGTRLQEPAGLCGRSVAFAELAVAIDHLAVDTGRDDGGVVAVDHPGQAAVERHLLFVILVHRVVEPGRIDHDEVGALAFTQRACREPEPVGNFGGEAVHRMSCG